MIKLGLRVFGTSSKSDILAGSAQQYIKAIEIARYSFTLMRGMRCWQKEVTSKRAIISAQMKLESMDVLK